MFAFIPLALLSACNTDPTVGTLPDNVGAAFAPCQESEIKFLATKHNVEPVFEPCGNNNNLASFQWSPDGSKLYFQLGTTGYVMDAVASNKATTTVPTPSPIGRAIWLTPTRVALPVGPEEADGSNRIAVFDIGQQSVYYRDIDAPFVPELVPAASPGEVLVVTADRDPAEFPDETQRSLVRMNVDDGSVTPAFDWLKPGFDTITATPAAQAVLVGRGETVTHYDHSGTEVASWSPALRGTLRNDGKWVALEHLGEEVSVFYQRAWDEMSDKQRRREAQRAERLAAQLPDSYPKTVRPPTLSFLDTEDGARWMITSFYGDQFQWYEAAEGYASFVFWGFEGKQFRRNVMLGQMASRLRATQIGRKFMGVVPMNEAAEAKKPASKDDKPDPEPSEAPAAAIK